MDDQWNTRHQSLISMGLRHQQHSTASHHHSAVPHLHGTRTLATPQLHTTTHQSFVSMGFKHQQHITSSHHHSSVHHLHGTHRTHKFTQPLISPSSPWDSQVHATTHQSIISMGLTSSCPHSSVHHLHGTWTQATLHKFTPPPTPNITTPDCLSVSLSTTTILVHFL